MGLWGSEWGAGEWRRSTGGVIHRQAGAQGDVWTAGFMLELRIWRPSLLGWIPSFLKKVDLFLNSFKLS